MGRRNDLSVSEVARIAGCHRNTVIRNEQKGIIQSVRDKDNFRRFPTQEALKLRDALNFRTEAPLVQQRDGSNA